MRLRDAIQSFLSDASKTKSKSTVQTYKCALSELSQFLKEDFELQTFCRKPATVQGLRDFLNADTCSESSKQVRLSAIKSFGAWLNKNNLTSRNVFQSIKSFKVKSPISDYISPDAINRCVQFAEDKKSIANARDACIIRLLFSTGITISELVALNLNDFCPNKKTLSIKSRSRPEIPLHPSMVHSLQLFCLSIRPQFKSNHLNPLFPNRFGNHLSRNLIAKNLKAIGSACDLPLNPRILRNSFIQFAKSHQMNSTDLHWMLGFRHMVSTQRRIQQTNQPSNTCV